MEKDTTSSGTAMKNLLRFALAFSISLMPQAICYQAYAASNDTVRANVNLDIPAGAQLTAPDNLTTVQNLVLDASNISFDTNLNASGRVSILWKGNTNAQNGMSVVVYRSDITGTAGSALKRDLTIYGAPGPGGDTPTVIAGLYAAGKNLGDIPMDKPEPFAVSAKPGSCLFEVQLGLLSPSNHGTGTANTVLTFVGAAL